MIEEELPAEAPQDDEPENTMPAANQGDQGMEESKTTNVENLDVPMQDVSDDMMYVGKMVCAKKIDPDLQRDDPNVLAYMWDVATVTHVDATSI